MSDQSAMTVVCPRCEAEPGARCVGLELGAHADRVAAWQAERRAHAAGNPDATDAARAIIAEIRRQHRWMTPGAGGANNGAGK